MGLDAWPTLLIGRDVPQRYPAPPACRQRGRGAGSEPEAVVSSLQNVAGVGDPLRQGEARLPAALRGRPQPDRADLRQTQAAATQGRRAIRRGHLECANHFRNSSYASTQVTTSPRAPRGEEFSLSV